MQSVLQMAKVGAEEQLPRLGAAVMIGELEACVDWLLEGDRDVEFRDTYRPEFLDGDWRTAIREAKRLLEGHSGRIGVHGPFMGLSLMAPDPRVQSLVKNRLRQALEIAAELGAGQMVIHSPFHAFGHPFLEHSRPKALSREIGLVRETLDKVLCLAQQIGCILVIENVYDCTPAPMIALVETLDDPYLKLSLDTGHALINERIGGLPIDEWVRAMEPHLAHVHLHDGDGHLDRHWIPGRGALNWFAFFEALTELPHAPRLLLETKPSTDPHQASAWLCEQGLAV